MNEEQQKAGWLGRWSERSRFIREWKFDFRKMFILGCLDGLVG